jgi:hypothetical protein
MLPQELPTTRSPRRGADGSGASDLQPRAAVRDDAPGDDGFRLAGAAAGVYGTESARALFRRGLVEQAQGDGPGAGAGGAGGAPSNGDAPASAAPVAVVPPPLAPTRPRRTRPLRAT